jgi:hypothetical protein
MQKSCNNKQSSSRIKNSRKQQKRQQQQTSSADILNQNNFNNNLMNSSLNTTTSDSSNSPSSNSSSSTERALTPSTIRKPGTTKGTWTREQVNRASLYLSSLKSSCRNLFEDEQNLFVVTAASCRIWMQDECLRTAVQRFKGRSWKKIGGWKRRKILCSLSLSLSLSLSCYSFNSDDHAQNAKQSKLLSSRTSFLPCI